MSFHTFMTNNYCDDDPCLEFTLDYKLGKKIRSNMNFFKNSSTGEYYPPKFHKMWEIPSKIAFSQGCILQLLIEFQI